MLASAGMRARKRGAFFSEFPVPQTPGNPLNLNVDPGQTADFVFSRGAVVIRAVREPPLRGERRFPKPDPNDGFRDIRTR